MELREIRTFLQIAQKQSFSKAAEALGYSQAAVTVQIKQLEEELGIHLFDRPNLRRIRGMPYGTQRAVRLACRLGGKDRPSEDARGDETQRLGHAANLTLQQPATV